MVALLDRFMPRTDIRTRHEILVEAPAPLVLEVARTYDLQSHPLVRAIFWLRTKLLRARRPAAWRSQGLAADMLRMGWGRLAEEPDRYLVAGATCQPWMGDVVFTPIPAERFAAFADPDQVKIAWTLEVEAIEPTRTRFATETRAVATDEGARRKFQRYWRLFGIGIRMIRWLMLPAMRREAERRWASRRS
jgi:hypothetical protein